MRHIGMFVINNMNPISNLKKRGAILKSTYIVDNVYKELMVTADNNF